MRKRLLAACTAVGNAAVTAGRAVAHASVGVVTHVRNYFAHPRVDQLVSADFGIKAGLFVLGALYTVAALLTSQVLTALCFGAFSAYCLWLMIKMNPWYTRMLVLARTEAELTDLITTNGDHVQASLAG